MPTYNKKTFVKLLENEDYKILRVTKILENSDAVIGIVCVVILSYIHSLFM